MGCFLPLILCRLNVVINVSCIKGSNIEDSTIINQPFNGNSQTLTEDLLQGVDKQPFYFLGWYLAFETTLNKVINIGWGTIINKFCPYHLSFSLTLPIIKTEISQSDLGPFTNGGHSIQDQLINGGH